MNRLIIFAGLLAATLQAWGAASWQNISYSTNPVTYAVITNVMGFTGSTTTYLRSDGTQATPAGSGGYAVTNYFITPSTGITVATNVTGTNVTWTLSSTVVSGGNMTNSGASVIGMVPVATDTTGTQWTPTNSISLDDVIAGTLSLSNMLANVVPVFDANTNMVPSSMTTNVLNLLYTESNNLTNWGKLATNSFQGASATLDHYAGTDTNALLSALGAAALAGATFTGNLAVTGTNVIGALAGKQAASAVLDHYAGTDTNNILTAIGGAPLAGATFTGSVLVGVTNLIGELAGKQALLSSLTSWNQVTLDTTNAVINLTNAVPGVDKNFYYSLSTSNYIIFSNFVQGAQGTIAINASGTPRQISFSSSYDNYSTNDLTYVGTGVWTLTNRCIIAYKIGWGTDATNVMLAIKKK